MPSVAIKHLCCYNAVKFIPVHRIQAFLDAFVFCGEATDSLFAQACIICISQTKSINCPFYEWFRQNNSAHCIAELRFNQLLARILLWAFTMLASAVVVNVFSLLDFAYNRTAAMTASDQTGERKIMLNHSVTIGVSAAENRLYLFP